MAWVGGNLVFGALFLTTCLWLARRYPEAALRRWLGDDLTGKRLADASAALDEIVAFGASKN